MAKTNFFSTFFSQFGKTIKTVKSPISPPMSPDSTHLNNVLIVWLDGHINEVNCADCQNTLTNLRKLTSNIKTFTDEHFCIEFMKTVKNETKMFLIISGSLSQTVVPQMQNFSQIYSIYIFCRDQAKYEVWALSWPIVRGVFTQISPICQLIRETIEQNNENSISMSFVPNNDQVLTPNLNQIDQSFMYTQILKEILLRIDFDDQSIKDFLNYCREQFADNSVESRHLDKIEQEYHDHSPIWWYTYDCFLYSMLNQALRTIQVDRIIKMGFFLRDLHEQIVRLHSEQNEIHSHKHIFNVYRGQCLSNNDFKQMLKTQGGLLSFNNFLSTSKRYHVSLRFARRALTNVDSIGVVFAISIDPLISSIPFASTKNMSCYQTEREILFSMHTVFRIGQISQIESDNSRLWRVELTLIADDDPQRRALTERMREETQGLTGWHRLGRLLILLGQFQKAEELYQILLTQSHDEYETANYNHHLGGVKDSQGDYTMAIHFYEKSLEINTKLLSADHYNLASSYIGLGQVYAKMNEFDKALSSHHRALEIFQNSRLPGNHRIAIAHGNIGRVYEQMGRFDEALASHELALKIFLNVLPAHDPNIGTCYCDLGKVYAKINQLDKALRSHEKALEIRREVLYANHPSLAASFYNVGQLLAKMGNIQRGLALIERAMEIGQRSLPLTHPDLETYRTTLAFYTDANQTKHCLKTLL